MTRVSPSCRLALPVTALLVAGAACGSAGGGTMKVGGCGIAFVHSAPIGADQSSQDIQNGLLRAGRELHTKIRTVEASGLESLGDNLRALAAKRCYSAIGTAFAETGDTVTKVARAFPKQRFFTIQSGTTAANVTDYTDAPEQLSFVAGAMAAAATRSKTVGAVFGVELPPVKRWKNGFVQGARFTDPSVRVLVNYVGSFTDPAKSATIAVTQAEQGADLVFAASGSDMEISRQGAAHRYRTIITNPDEYRQAEARGDAVALASIEDMGNIAYGAIKDLIGPSPAHGTKNFSFAEHVFGVTGVTGRDLPGKAPLPKDVVAAGEKAYQALTSGKAAVKDPTR